MVVTTGHRSRPLAVRRYSWRGGWSLWGTFSSTPCLVRLPRRWFRMLREMPSRSWNWSKRVTPRKASRTISIDHHSPTTSRHCATEQCMSAKLLRSTEPRIEGCIIERNLLLWLPGEACQLGGIRRGGRVEDHDADHRVVGHEQGRAVERQRPGAGVAEPLEPALGAGHVAAGPEPGKVGGQLGQPRGQGGPGRVVEVDGHRGPVHGDVPGGLLFPVGD